MTQPHALLVAFHYPPEVSGGIPRALIMEDFLVRAGWRVTVLTPQPIGRGSRGGDVVRVPLPAGFSPLPSAPAAERPLRRSFWPSVLKSAVRRMLVPDVYLPWSLRAARRAVAIARTTPVDLVITSSPPESVHRIGRCLQRLCRATWLADFRDGWTWEPHRPEALLPLRRQLERRLERRVLERADWITAATLPLAENLRQRCGHRQNRIHLLPTGFEPWPRPACDAGILPVHDSAGILPACDYTGETPVLQDGLFRMVYTGRFGLSRNGDTPAVFFAGLRKAVESHRPFAERFRLRLVGAFTAADRRLWSDPPLAGCVEEIGPRPYEEALQLSSEATMLLLVTPAGQRSVATRKLFDYLAVHRPIFALAAGNEAARILGETQAGTCVPPDDADAVAAALLRVFAGWQRGALDAEIPCTGNDCYRADLQFSQVLGATISSAALRPAA